MALFVYSGAVSRYNKSMKIDFSLTLMVYHRKISTCIKKTKCFGKLGIYQRFDLVKKCFKKCYFTFCINC